MSSNNVGCHGHPVPIVRSVEQGRLRGKLIEEEFEKVLSTYVKGRLSPGPDGVISELLRGATSTERRIILHWINDVLTSDEPGLR